MPSRCVPPPYRGYKSGASERSGYGVPGLPTHMMRVTIGVPARRIGRDAFPGGLAAFKHHALGLSAADFGSDAMGAQRSAAASLSVSQAEFGSADRVGLHHPAIAHDGQFSGP